MIGLPRGSRDFDVASTVADSWRTSSLFDMISLVPTSLPLVQCCAPLGDPALTEAEAKELETVFKALADRHRVKILNRLLAAGGEAVCVCDFEALLGLEAADRQLPPQAAAQRRHRHAREARLVRLLLDRAGRLRADPRPPRGARSRSRRLSAPRLATRDRHAGRSGRLGVTADRRGRAVVRQYDVGRLGGGDVGIERPDDGDRA